MSSDKLSVASISRTWWAETHADKVARKRILYTGGVRISDVMMLPEVMTLTKRLNDNGHPPTPKQVAAVAYALMLVDAHAPQSAFTGVLGKAKNRFGKPLITKEAFYHALSNVMDRESFFRTMRSSIDRIDMMYCNVEDLANDIWYWNNDTKIRWAMSYALTTSEIS